jgi:lysophospholipase L1-like esterase
MRTLIFGDSIVYGCWDTEGGWADRLKQDVHRKYVSSDGEVWHDVLNLGVSGDTSSHIRDRLRSEIEFRSHDSSGLTLVFAFGTNDARLTDNQPETSFKRFKENIVDITVIAQAYANNIMFVGPPPLAEPTISAGSHIEHDDKVLMEYEKQYRHIVEKAGLLYVPLRPAFVERGLEGLYSFDKLHPKDEGHQLIFEIISQALADSF